MNPSDDKQLDKLQDEFSAARSAESSAARLINNALDSGGKDMVALQKVTEEMLRTHDRSMGYYLKLLKYKLQREKSGDDSR